MANPAFVPSLWYVGWDRQLGAGSGVAPKRFMRCTAMPMGQPVIKATKLRDGFNRNYFTEVKDLQYGQVQFTGYLTPDAAMSLFSYAIGASDATTGSTATNSTTTSAPNAAGDTTMAVTATTGFVNNVIIQIGTGLTAECVKQVGAISTNTVTFTPALRYAHLSGATVAQVVAPFTHTGSETNNAMNLLSFEHSIGNGLDVVRYTDSYIEEMKLSAKAGSVVQVDCKAIGVLTTPQASAATVAFDADRVAEFIDGVMTLGSGLNVANGNLSNLDIDIKNAIQTIPLFGSNQPALNPQTREDTLSLEAYLTTKAAFRDVFYNGDSSTAIANTLQQLASLTALFDLATSPDHTSTIVINNVNLEDAKPSFNTNASAFYLGTKGTAIYDGVTSPITYQAINSTYIPF